MFSSLAVIYMVLEISEFDRPELSVALAAESPVFGSDVISVSCFIFRSLKASQQSCLDLKQSLTHQQEMNDLLQIRNKQEMADVEEQHKMKIMELLQQHENQLDSFKNKYKKQIDKLKPSLVSVVGMSPSLPPPSPMFPSFSDQ